MDFHLRPGERFCEVGAAAFVLQGTSAQEELIACSLEQAWAAFPVGLAVAVVGRLWLRQMQVFRTDRDEATKFRNTPSTCFATFRHPGQSQMYSESVRSSPSGDDGQRRSLEAKITSLR